MELPVKKLVSTYYPFSQDDDLFGLIRKRARFSSSSLAFIWSDHRFPTTFEKWVEGKCDADPVVLKHGHDNEPLAANIASILMPIYSIRTCGSYILHEPSEHPLNKYIVSDKVLKSLEMFSTLELRDNFFEQQEPLVGASIVVSPDRLIYSGEKLVATYEAKSPFTGNLYECVSNQHLVQVHCHMNAAGVDRALYHCYTPSSSRFWTVTRSDPVWDLIVEGVFEVTRMIRESKPHYFLPNYVLNRELKQSVSSSVTVSHDKDGLVPDSQRSNFSQVLSFIGK